MAKLETETRTFSCAPDWPNVRQTTRGANATLTPVKRVLLALAATLAPVLAAAPAHASCAATVRFGGVAYFGSSLSAREGSALHGGVRPGCNDQVVRDSQGNDISPREPDEQVQLSRVRGVPARLAVAYEGRVYLAEGYLPQLARHPLHRAWARGVQAPSSCGTAWRVNATVSVTPTPGPIPVATAGGRNTLLDLSADTRVHGLDVAGYPHLRQGEKIRALVRSCSSPYGGHVLETLRLTRSL
jgi:hypothetical protein